MEQVIQLIQRIALYDDQAAFKQLYQMLFFRLFQFAYSFLRSKESSEEIVNDVFLALWQKRSSLGSILNINVYLYVAVKNASLKHLRKHRMPLPVSLESLTTQHLHLQSTPESLLITSEIQAYIQNAVEQLPPRCKLIFKLIKEDGLSYKEVAQILKISVKTVDAQMYLALKKLARTLSPVWKEYHSQGVPNRS